MKSIARPSKTGLSAEKRPGPSRLSRVLLLAYVYRSPMLIACAFAAGALWGASQQFHSAPPSVTHEEVTANETKIDKGQTNKAKAPAAATIASGTEILLTSPSTMKEEPTNPDDRSKEPKVRSVQNSAVDLGEIGNMDKTISDLGLALDRMGDTVGKMQATLSEVKHTDSVAANQPKAEIAGSPAVKVSMAEDLVKVPDSLDVASPDDKALRSQLAGRLEAARKSEDKSAAEQAKRELEMFDATLSTEIDFRIADDGDKRTGFWRAKSQSGPKQYFVAVEAFADGKKVKWSILDSDTGKIVAVDRFGLEVDEKTFAAIAADKKADGKIDKADIGLKPVGRILPVWAVNTDGTTIAGI